MRARRRIDTCVVAIRVGTMGGARDRGLPVRRRGAVREAAGDVPEDGRADPQLLRLQEHRANAGAGRARHCSLGRRWAWMASHRAASTWTPSRSVWPLRHELHAVRIRRPAGVGRGNGPARPATVSPQQPDAGGVAARLCVRDVVANIPRAAGEPEGAQRCLLPPGEERAVTFEPPTDARSFHGRTYAL